MRPIIGNHLKIKYIFKATLFCIVFTGLFVVLSLAKGFLPTTVERLAHGIIGTLAAFLTTLLFLTIDKKQFSEIGLSIERSTVVKFLGGVAIGIVIMGLLATSVLYFTHAGIEVNPGSNLLHFLVVTAPLLPLAFMEEVGFRAYPLQILKGRVGIRLAIIITSILFALYHIVNGWTIASSFLGPAIWGLVFGLAAIYAKGIAMPTGIHYAANLTTSAFGVANNTVSIWTIKQPNTSTTTYAGIDWVTIVPAFALLLFAIICIELYLRQKSTANNALAKAGLT